MGVGNMQVYLGALLVIVLGFLSGLFSLGAKQIAHATPSAVKEAIVQPFQLIGQQAKNTRDQSSQVNSWARHPHFKWIALICVLASLTSL